jgi:hypothetical protein
MFVIYLLYTTREVDCLFQNVILVLDGTPVNRYSSLLSRDTTERNIFSWHWLFLEFMTICIGFIGWFDKKTARGAEEAELWTLHQK